MFGQAVPLLLLLLLCLLVVFRILPYQPVLICVILVILVINRKLYWSVIFPAADIFMLFHIIGNMKRIPGISEFLVSVVQGRELLTGILTSQIISNVPAAILLSGFSSDFSALLTGVNLAGSER